MRHNCASGDQKVTFDFANVFRYVDLQPVGMGAFGLVWYDLLLMEFGAELR